LFLKYQIITANKVATPFMQKISAKGRKCYLVSGRKAIFGPCLREWGQQASVVEKSLEQFADDAPGLTAHAHDLEWR